MPACSIIQCGSRKNKNQPGLSIHKFPKNENMKKKWRDAIGAENINPKHKDLWICSLHFEERHFNRTLDVMRLRDNTVPSLFTVPQTNKKDSSVFTEENVGTSSLVNHDAYNLIKDEAEYDDISIDQVPTRSTTEFISRTSQINDEAEYDDICIDQVPTRSTTEFMSKTTKDQIIKQLRNKCFSQRNEIKRLNEVVHTQYKKILNLTNIIKILTKETS